MHYTILLFGNCSLATTRTTRDPPFLGCVWRPNVKGGLRIVCSRLRRCKTVGRMPMQNHMWAKIRDNNSISHAWILAPCLAPVRRKMFRSYVWIFALLLLHIKISGQDFLCYYPSFNYCTRFFCLQNDLHSTARHVTQNYTCITQILVGNYLSCA